MDDATRQAFESIYLVLWGVGILVQIGIAVAAFLRLKATAAGILVGGGFSVLVLLSIVARTLRAVIGRGPDAVDALMAVSAASSVLQMTVMLLVGVGILLVPSSLERLSKQS